MKNEYKVTKDLMMSWAREYYIVGAAQTVWFVMYIILGVISLILFALLFAFGGEWTQWYCAALFLILSVYQLFFSRFAIMSRRYALFSKTYGVHEWIRTTEFSEEEIVFTDHNSIARLKYENIKKIKEKGNTVMIFFNGNIALRLYKDAFVEGSWEECKELLNSKY